MKTFFLFFFLTLCFPVFSQSLFTYSIEFTDKNNSAWSVEHPEQFLSQKSLKRRKLHHIPVTTSDLPVNEGYAYQVLNAGNFTLLYPLKWLNAVVITMNDTVALSTIRQLPFVKSIRKITEKDSRRNGSTIHKFEIENQQNDFDYGVAATQVKMLNVLQLHNIGYTGNGIIIAVFDAGFSGVDTMEAFQYLRANAGILGTRDFVEPSGANLYKDTHGRSVLSTMAAYSPGEMIGTAPDASYWLIRTEDGSSETILEEYNWLAAAEFADSIGVDIINSSLGYTIFDNPAENHTYSDMDGNTTVVTKAADMAAAKGILVVNSAGNSGNNSWKYIGAPADADSILSVGAVGGDSAKATFSSFGPTADGRIKPNVAAMGLSVKVINSMGNVSTSNGTSFSGPLISGASACLWQAFPGESNMNLIDAIQNSAHQASNPDTLLGYGIPDFYQAYYNLFDTNNILDSDIFTCYPNPVSTYLNIEYFSTGDKKVEVSIFQINGQLVNHETLTVNKGRNLIQTTFDWGTLSKSVYFVKLVNEANTVTRRIVKF